MLGRCSAMLGDARKTSTKSLCQAPNADLGLEGALLYARCCVQLVPNEWVCALGGPRDPPLLSASAGSARAPPPLNSAFNRDRCYRGFLPPLPQAGRMFNLWLQGQCLSYGVVYIFGYFGPTQAVPSASNIDCA